MVICDYPLNPAYTANTHTAATMTALAAIGRAGHLPEEPGRLGRGERKPGLLHLLPDFAADALSINGVRNDLYVDITPVVGRKIAAMDCFASQGYDGQFARKLIESNNGESAGSPGSTSPRPTSATTTRRMPCCRSPTPRSPPTR